MQIDQWDFPDELYYHKEHSWVRIEDDIAVIGVNDFTQFLAGEISYVDLPMEGDKFAVDAVMGTIETGKWLGKLYAPVSGEIIEVNEALDDEPTLINSSPYGDGWMVKLKISDASELQNLMQGEAVVDFINSEVDRVANK